MLVALSAIGPRWPAETRFTLRAVGAALCLVALALNAWNFAALGRSLTPLPRPRANARLVETGPYGRVRHPIYSAVLLLALGWSLLFSPLSLVPAAALALLFDGKARREEAWLDERYPGYSAYCTRTPRRFVPGIY